MTGTINSIKDGKIVLTRDLNSRKGRQEHGKVLLEGEEIVDWAIESGVDVEYLLLSDRSPAAAFEKYVARGIEVFAVSEGVLKKATDTNYVVPVVGVGKTQSVGHAGSGDFVVVLDSVKDFGNIGTIVRTCHAFGIRDIVSSTNDFDLFQRKTIEASRGTVFATRAECFPNPDETVRQLKARGYQIVATSPKGEGLQSLVELKRAPVALIVGNETSGISREFEEQADFLIQIPMYHTVESLNVGVATGISVYELRLKQVLTMIEERIKSTLGRELNVAGALVQQALDAELKKATDLTSNQVIFMMVLRCDRTMEIRDMCRQFGVLESEAEDFLTPMVKQGLVVSDERLTLTGKGEEVLGKLWFIVENVEGRLVSGLSSGEASALMEHLRMIQTRCVEIITGQGE